MCFVPAKSFVECLVMGFRVAVLRNLFWFGLYLATVCCLQVYIINNVDHFPPAHLVTVCNQRHENLVIRQNVISDRSQIYQTRRDQIRKACAKLNRSPSDESHIGPQVNLYWNADHQFAFCPTGKSGAISWIKFLYEMSGLPVDNRASLRALEDQLEHTLRFPTQMSPRVQHIIFKQAFSFTFVAHPFVRLVGYYDVLVGHPDHAETIDWFHSNTSQQALNNVPSFSAFVDYFTNNLEFDPKAGTAVGKCDVCALDYNVTGKMETFEEDRKYILAHTNLDQLLHALQPISGTQTGLATAYRLTKEYFAELSKAQVERLVQIYIIDFEAFDYSYQDFMPI